MHARRPCFLALLLLPLILAATGCATSPPPEAALHQARFILLGEVHDNGPQHEARVALLSRLLLDGRKTTVVFEQMGREFDAALASAPREAEAQSSAGALDRKGWRWPLHKPLFDAALAGGALLRGGNISREQARALVREGEPAWPADLAPIKRATPWSEAQQQTLVKDIEAGHCNAMPARLLPGMALAQRGRDAAMAQAMLKAQADGAERVVLIAGNGHVRRDLAVPLYLQAMGVAPGEIVSRGYLEEGGEANAAAAAPPRYDAVLRFAKVEREDPCKVLINKR